MFDSGPSRRRGWIGAARKCPIQVSRAPWLIWELFSEHVKFLHANLLSLKVGKRQGWLRTLIGVRTTVFGACMFGIRVRI